MYENLKRTCNNGITFANIKLKNKEEYDYFLGVRNTYAVILRQLIRQEDYIKLKRGDNKCYRR